MGITRMGPLTFQQPVQCHECEGEGNLYKNELKKTSTKFYLLSMFLWLLIGEVVAHKDKCPRCHGNQIVEEKKSLDVVILPGYIDGKKIKFREENDQLVRNRIHELFNS